MTKICIDLNGVLADTTKGLCERIRKDLGILVPTRTFDKNRVGEVFPNVVAGGLPKKLTQNGYRTVKSVMFDTVAFLEVPPVKGAPQALRALVNHGFTIVVVTDARSVSRERVASWLVQHAFPHEQMDIILTRSCRSKEPHQCGCDVVVDNEIEQLIPLLQQEGDGNRARPVPIHFLPKEGTAGCDIALSSSDSRIRSLRGWDEVLGMLLEMEHHSLAA